LVYGSCLTLQNYNAKLQIITREAKFQTDKRYGTTEFLVITNNKMGKIVAVCISEKKGTQKRDVHACRLIEHFGLEGDAHAGKWHRQVSLLAKESADIMRERGLHIKDGDFGENIVTEGIELKSLPVGAVLRIGEDIIIRITQIGKLCHERCAIYYKAGDCIMPREGIFAEIIKGGTVKVGDEITVLEKDAVIKI